ncbi:hypothetical protein Tco_1286322 [Tanacetum coccineum]
MGTWLRYMLVLAWMERCVDIEGLGLGEQFTFDKDLKLFSNRLIQYNVDVRRMEEINADALYDAWKRIDSTKYVQIGGSPPETRRANDLSLFARGHLNYVSVPTDALEEFKNVSDLVPSIPKSNAYFCNVPNVFKVAILNYMPFEEGTLCILVLLIVSILLYCDYMVLIERLQHQITDWKNKFLSFVGRP